MEFKFVIGDPDGTGNVYAIDAAGGLYFYKDKNRNGTANWQEPTQIGNDWHHFRHVFAGGDGILYAINEAGQLLFYQDLARNGTSSWHPNSGHVIGSGWSTFLQVFYGGDSSKPGIIYAVFPDGNLRYYRDLGRNGTANWENSGLARYIGGGWQGLARLFADDGGIIYAINQAGDLLFFKDSARDGSNDLGAPSTGAKIGGGWGGFYEVFANGGGVIYTVTSDGALMFYQDTTRNGQQGWANNGYGQQLRSDMIVSGAFSGYCWPLSAQPGGQIAFKVSSPDEYTVTYRRLNTVLVAPQDGSYGVAKGDSFTMAAEPQGNPDPSGVTAAQNGFGWNTSFTLAIPADWESGIYAAHLSKTNRDYYVIFIVNPLPTTQDRWPTRIVTLANTNTWNAYNDTGGVSKYSCGAGYLQSFDRPNPATQPFRGVSTDAVVRNAHLTAAELWVLNWLENNNYGIDVYTDQDFHAFDDSQIAAFAKYGALLLSTHPEYWTRKMYSNLEKYLAAGGSVIYLAGNGVCEHVEYSAQNPLVGIYFEGNPNSTTDLFAGVRSTALFRNLVKQDAAGNEIHNPDGTKAYMTERALLGVAFRSDNAFWLADPDPAAPFKVLDADARFFANTGLNIGDTFGAQGYNGPASGWEMDTSLKGSAPDDTIVALNESHETDALKGADNCPDDRGAPPQVPSFKLLARGTNSGYGADMTYYETGHTQPGRNPAFVFTVGSLTAGGALVVDGKLQQIVKNVLHIAGL